MTDFPRSPPHPRARVCDRRFFFFPSRNAVSFYPSSVPVSGRTARRGRDDFSYPNSAERQRKWCMAPQRGFHSSPPIHPQTCESPAEELAYSEWNHKAPLNQPPMRARRLINSILRRWELFFLYNSVLSRARPINWADNDYRHISRPTRSFSRVLPLVTCRVYLRFRYFLLSPDPLPFRTHSLRLQFFFVMMRSTKDDFALAP